MAENPDESIQVTPADLATKDSETADPTSIPGESSEAPGDTDGVQDDTNEGTAPDASDEGGDATDPDDPDAEQSANDLESMTADRDRWKGFSRQWETRAKASQDKVRELEEATRAQAEELQQMRSANLKREIATEFQVPENLLHGEDRDQMVQVAKDLSAWSQTSVRPRTSAIATPSSGRGQATAGSTGRQAAADALRRLRATK